MHAEFSVRRTGLQILSEYNKASFANLSLSCHNQRLFSSCQLLSEFHFTVSVWHSLPEHFGLCGSIVNSDWEHRKTMEPDHYWLLHHGPNFISLVNKEPSPDIIEDEGTGTMTTEDSEESLLFSKMRWKHQVIYIYMYILLTALLRLTFAVYGRSIVRPDFGQCGRESWARRIHVCLWTWSSQSSEPDRPLFIQGGTTVSILAGKSSAKTTTLIPPAWWAWKNFNSGGPFNGFYTPTSMLMRLPRLQCHSLSLEITSFPTNDWPEIICQLW